MKFIWEKFNFPDEEEFEDENPYEREEETPNKLLSKLINSNPNPFVQPKSFNFWILHTDFYLTPNIVINTTSNVLGIESADIISPYRLYVSVGKAFDEDVVKQNIETHIQALNEQS